MSDVTLNTKADDGQSSNPRRLRSREVRDARQGMKDAALIEKCAEFEDLFAGFINGCKVLEEVEISSPDGRNVDEVELQIVMARRQWRAALRRLTIAAHTSSGRLAKARAIQKFFLEFPAGDDVMVVVESLLRDLENLS